MGLLVSELFFSIQGESTYAGRPCAFVRLAGCNLRCSYCDTVYAQSDSPDNGKTMSIDEIIRAVAGAGLPIVEITGGEPLFQEETPALARRLLAEGFTVLTETNGSFDIRAIDSRCIRIVDMKCPGSGMAHRMDRENIRRMGKSDELKFVLCDRADYDHAKAIVLAEAGRINGGRILFSAAAGRLDPATLASWIIADRLDVRMQIQLHKILWPGVEQGV